MHTQENQQIDADSNETSDPEDDDDDTNTCYRRTLTDKLVRSFRVHQQHMARRHKMTIEQALASHASSARQYTTSNTSKIESQSSNTPSTLPRGKHQHYNS